MNEIKNLLKISSSYFRKKAHTIYYWTIECIFQLIKIYKLNLKRLQTIYISIIIVKKQ